MHSYVNQTRGNKGGSAMNTGSHSRKKKAYNIAIKDPEMFLAVMGVLRGR